jgi:plastocyanin
MNKGLWILVILIVIVAGIVMWMRPEAGAPATNEPTTSEPTVSTGDPTPTPTPGVREFAVTGANFTFSPAELRAKVGDTVRITFTNAEGFHDLVIDEFKVATKQLKANESEMVEFVADKAGTFEYYCSVGTHRQMGMVGKLVVE